MKQLTGSKLIERIQKCMNKLTPRQLNFANFVLQNTDRIGFLSITEAAKEAKVSQTTIFRFCTSLGYDGYLPFSREIQQEIMMEMTTQQRFKLSEHQLEGDARKKKISFLHLSLPLCMKSFSISRIFLRTI